jgi:hypothetical protein
MLMKSENFEKFLKNFCKVGALESKNFFSKKCGLGGGMVMKSENFEKKFFEKFLKKFL